MTITHTTGYFGCQVRCPQPREGSEGWKIGSSHAIAHLERHFVVLAAVDDTGGVSQDTQTVNHMGCAQHGTRFLLGRIGGISVDVDILISCRNLTFHKQTHTLIHDQLLHPPAKRALTASSQASGFAGHVNQVMPHQ